MAKSVAVVLEEAPINSRRTSEGLRMSVGLILGKHAVSVLLFGDAALAALPSKPQAVGGAELAKHIGALGMLKQKVYAEREALAKFGLAEAATVKGVEVKERSELLQVLAESDAVIRF